MDRERLTRLVKDAGAVQRADLDDLRALSERYPWFSAAQLLRAAGEQRSGEVLYDETLGRTAAHVPTRTRLFDLVTGDQRATPKLTIVPKEAEEPPVVGSTATSEATTVPPAAPLTSEVEAPAPPVETMAVAPPTTTEVEAASTMVVPEELPAGPEAVDTDDPLDRQILEAAWASAYDLTMLEPLPATPPPTTADPVPVAASTVPLPGEVSPSVPIEVPEKVADEQVAASVTLPPSGRLRFSDWLSLETPPNTLAAGLHDLPVTESDTPPPPTTDPARPTTPKRSATPQETTALIDRFMQQETPEPKAKATFFTPQQAAKKSLDDTAGMVTETLARIYEKQGNIAKAIDAYHRLGLKYPEKAAYFAALAKALEERSTN